MRSVDCCTAARLDAYLRQLSVQPSPGAGAHSFLVRPAYAGRSRSANPMRRAIPAVPLERDHDVLQQRFL